MYFNKRNVENLDIKLSTFKAYYKQREAATVNIEVLKAKGEFLNLNASVLVLNKGELGGALH